LVPVKAGKEEEGTLPMLVAVMTHGASAASEARAMVIADDSELLLLEDSPYPVDALLTVTGPLALVSSTNLELPVGLDAGEEEGVTREEGREAQPLDLAGGGANEESETGEGGFITRASG
jgi:hypothetical protein